MRKEGLPRYEPVEDLIRNDAEGVLGLYYRNRHDWNVA